MTRRATGTAPTPAPLALVSRAADRTALAPITSCSQSRACRRARPWRPLFARSWAPPFTPRAGPPGAAPLTTPQWGCAPSRGTPDGLIPIVLRASGWRSSPVPGARPRLRPPARRGRVSRSHPQAIHWPSTCFSTGYPPDPAISLRLSEPTNRARIAPLGRTHSRRASAAWARPRSCPHNPATTRTTPCRRPSHILERSLRRPVIWLGGVP